MNQVERLLNLITLLLESPEPVTFQRLREQMSEAYGQTDVESAKRMFERDKDILRESEIPLRTVKNSAGDDAYTIRKEEYYLPQIDFTSEELAALFVAARSSGPDPLAEEAMHKLAFRSDAGSLAPPSALAIAGPDLVGPRVLAVAAAIAGARRISFTYRTGTGEVGERTFDPYAVLYRSGNWYAVGTDVTKGEPRSFRISRFASGVDDAGNAQAPPEGFDAAAVFHSGPSEKPEDDLITAKVAIPDWAWWIPREAPGARAVGTSPDGRTIVEVPVSEEGRFVSWVLSQGPDAEILEPERLRRALVSRLEAALASL
jgi:predicted DNA-binding transcriptional regulator YafY